jgi:hypothetical protein
MLYDVGESSVHWVNVISQCQSVQTVVVSKYVGPRNARGYRMNAGDHDCLMTHSVKLRSCVVVRDTSAAVRSQAVIGHLTV